MISPTTTTTTTTEEVEGEALESLLESSKTPEGRARLASDGVLPDLLRRLSSRPLPHHHLLLSLRLLRNLCAGEAANQDAFLEAGGPDAVASAILRSSTPAAPLEIVRVGLQLLGNVAVAGEAHRSAVWGRFFSDGFLELARVRDAGVCDPLCMVLRTCCCSSGEGSRGRLEELCGVGRGLPVLTEIVTTACSAGYQGDWLQLLLSRICFEEPYFPLLFSEFSSFNFSESQIDVESRHSLFTTEQAFLLGLLSDILSQQLYKGIISDDFALAVLQVLKGASCVVDFTSRGMSPLPTGSPAIDVVGYSLIILRDICAWDNSSSPATEILVDSLLSSGLCRVLLDLLRDLEPPPIIRKSLSNGANQGLPSGTFDSSKVCPYKGFRRDIVSVIGNCMCGRRHVQDEIRQRNGILLLLQQCVIDEENPFLREWGMLTISYLLEDSMENQRQLAELELQGSVDTPEIANLGLKVEVDKKTGCVKLVNA